MSENAAQEKFGNWLQPASPGLFGLSLGGVVISAAGLVFGLLALMRGLFLLALAVLLITALTVLLGLVKFGGRTVLGRVTDALSLASRKSTGSAFYVTGALSTLPPEDAERLPGALLDVVARRAPVGC